MTDTRPTHVYLSTGCLHGRHDYCQSMTGLSGTKRPARCKFCDATCTCTCHTPTGIVYAPDGPHPFPDAEPLPAHADPFPLADLIKITPPPDPIPVDGLTLDLLQTLSQDIEHCDTPMRVISIRTTWEGPPGNGAQIDISQRACIRCGATATITTSVPS